ncbi:O-methylsterigmatocystin oxidoreductase [Favolaschia claudopus]|uniref:O-methylsterigmatocystin oxidoreductase n=1 Tax=Favolaschia claudopus TaxID=2862362 RepID=A0AAW0DA26_9AGAR
MPSLDYLSSFILTSLVVIVALLLLRGWNRTYRLPFPPGPEPRFLIGNLLDIPATYPWKTYAEWGKKYGDVIHIESFGNHVLVINSLQAAIELLERRAHIFSDRPTFPMLALNGWDMSFGFMRYGAKWRQHRRMFHQYFRREAIPSYYPIQSKKINELLRNLLSNPEDFVQHIQTLAAANIMAIVYGYDVKPKDDPFVDLAEDAVERFAQSFLPDVWVNSFPFLRYFPSWFPGCGFHRFARETVPVVEEMKSLPFDFVKQTMRDGDETFSVVRELLEKNDIMNGGSAEQETIIKHTTAAAYAGITGPITSSTLHVFFLAMALYPQVVRRAQNEIDAVVGHGRFPQFEDRKEMPYCEAVFREIFRWQATVPLALPHATSEDDVFRGCFIPKGRVILGTGGIASEDINILAMLHDESVYANPEEFDPERFLNTNVDGQIQLNANDRILNFGFGRRICVGRHAADSVVWAAMFSVLAMFDISKARDGEGDEIAIEPILSGAALSHPLPFRCAITCRSEAAKQLVERTTEF